MAIRARLNGQRNTGNSPQLISENTQRHNWKPSAVHVTYPVPYFRARRFMTGNKAKIGKLKDNASISNFFEPSQS